MDLDGRWYHLCCSKLRPLCKNRFRMHKCANHLKLFPAFELQGFVAFDILWLLRKCRRCFLYIIVISKQVTKLVQMVSLRRMRSVDVAQAFLENWVNKYGLSKILLSRNGNQFTYLSFQKVCQMLRIASAFTTISHLQIKEQVKRYIRILTAMICYYVNNRQQG